MYSMWKIMFFFYVKPYKHIALMFFLATSYDPFKGGVCNFFKNALEN